MNDTLPAQTQVSNDNTVLLARPEAGLRQGESVSGGVAQLGYGRERPPTEAQWSVMTIAAEALSKCKHSQKRIGALSGRVPELTAECVCSR